jgi:trimethylguanosine synthase
MGIQLDAEGWFSVTPEVIADHVAQRVGALATSAAFRRGLPGNLPEIQGIIVMDAFCGCGGNSIAFGKLPFEQVSMVVCVDLDRTKLRKAAHNACLYDIPKEKLIFVECNTLFVMEHCYQNGSLQINQLRSIGVFLPDHVPTEVCEGFFIGGLGMLPARIDAVFMDPPWGGVDYNALGKNGYSLENHMKIKTSGTNKANSAVHDNFFDSFGTSGHIAPAEDDNCMNGVDLLAMAASATKSRLVIYDLPRNTNKSSLGQSALVAGYRGNIKLEEHYLNGRLKTVTAYMGADYSRVLLGSEEQSS